MNAGSGFVAQFFPLFMLGALFGLVTYAACPKRFYWSEVDRLPRRPRRAMQRGVQLHRRIELHNRGKVPLEEASPDLYDLAPAEDAGRVDTGFTAFLGSRFAAQRPLLVHVGRLAFEKNCDFLLRMLVHVKAELPDVLLVIAGGGPARGVRGSCLAA